MLIHLDQWTVAIPVGKTFPAKQQKKPSCVIYWQDWPGTVNLLDGAFYFLSRQRDVISFYFGACTCRHVVEKLSEVEEFVDLLRN